MHGQSFGLIELCWEQINIVPETLANVIESIYFDNSAKVLAIPTSTSKVIKFRGLRKEERKTTWNETHIRASDRSLYKDKYRRDRESSFL